MTIRVLTFFLLIWAGPAEARSIVATAASTPASDSLATSLTESLIRTDRYSVIEIPRFDGSCPALPRPDYVLSVTAVPSQKQGAKINGRVRIFDCRTGKWLPTPAEAKSSKLETLAASLKADLVELLPLVEPVELDGSMPCIAGGTAHALRPGSRLWWTNASGELLGRFVVQTDAPADGCAQLAVSWRTSEQYRPQAGEFVTDRIRTSRKARLYHLPAIGRIAPKRPVVDSGTDEIAIGFERLTSLPEIETAWISEITPDPAAKSPVTIVWNGKLTRPRTRPAAIKTGYEFILYTGGWKLMYRSDKDKALPLGSGRFPRWIPDSGSHSVSGIRSGRWFEIYVDNRFVVGLDDDSLSGGDLFISKSGKPLATISSSDGGMVQPLE